MSQGGLIDKCDVRVVAAGATALQIEEVSPTARTILFPNKFVLDRVDKALTSIKGGKFTHIAIPEEKAIKLEGIIPIDYEILGLGGNWEFLIGNGRWSIQKRLPS